MNDKITAINMIERILFVLNKNNKYEENECITYTRDVDININPLVKSVVAALKIPDDKLISVSSLTDSHEKMNTLYFILVQDFYKLQHEYVGVFNTKINNYNYTFLCIDADTLCYTESSWSTYKIMSIYKIIDILINSKVLNVSSKDFNILEKDYLFLLCLYDMYGKEEKFFELTKYFVKEQSMYNQTGCEIYRRLAIEWSNLDEILEYFNDHGDDPEFLDDIFTRLGYIHFMNDFRLEEFERWEKEYRSHS